jgi:hypothetical protein
VSPDAIYMILKAIVVVYFMAIGWSIAASLRRIADQKKS